MSLFISWLINRMAGTIVASPFMDPAIRDAVAKELGSKHGPHSRKFMRRYNEIARCLNTANSALYSQSHRGRPATEAGLKDLI